MEKRIYGEAAIELLRELKTSDRLEPFNVIDESSPSLQNHERHILIIDLIGRITKTGSI